MRSFVPAVLLLAALGAAPTHGADPALVREVVKTLNDHATVNATEDASCYRILFDARLAMSPAPYETGRDFNLDTIHPGMPEWSTVSGWAESNGPMVEALRKSAEKTLIGLPYGRDAVSSRYRDAGIYVEVGRNDVLHDISFPYLAHVDLIAAFATAEAYRLLEADDGPGAFALYRSLIFVLRQFCDRDFLAEKTHHIDLLSRALSNLRDLMYVSRDDDSVSAELISNIGWADLPFLRPDRGRLLMPEADRVVASALIDDVFDPTTGNAIPEKFAESFAGIQSADQPLTRFGAARRWSMIAQVHGSYDASTERLDLVYDDWWRRWRVREYDEILAVPTQFDRTNEVRYAAVIYSMQNIEDLFAVRNRLIAEVNGTAMAAGLVAYYKTFDNYPSSSINVRPQFVRKSSDTDPFDRGFGPFKYRLFTKRTAVDTPDGRVWIEADECILYSLGQDLHDGGGTDHTPDGVSGDLVIWPPIKSLTRE